MILKKQESINVIDFRKELKDRESEIQLLQETFRLVASELDLGKIFDIIAKRAMRLVDAETLLIPILDDNKETYTYRAGAGVNAEEIVGEALPLDYGVCGWVWKNKRAWWRGVLDELDEHERNQWEKEAGTLILVPLQGRKHFLGGIAAINKKDGLEFTRRDMEMLSMFAGLVSIAIENAMSFKQLTDTQEMLIEHQRRLERLNKQYSESNRKIEQLSLYDPLTNLPNRVLFRDRFDTQLKVAVEEKQHLSLLLIDIYNFKAINDNLGHEAGDQILIEFCNRIQKLLKQNETLGRLGNDEFSLIIPETTYEKTLIRAQSLLSATEKPLLIEGKKINIQANIGISIYPEHGLDMSTMLRHADIALNIAKKNNEACHLFDFESDETGDTQLSLALDINEALNDDQFELYYQPKIDLKSKAIISVEALGRWKHPTKGFISPGIFIEALEQYNQIDNYTYKIIDSAIETINHWVNLGYNLKVAINISTRTLVNPDFFNQVKVRLSDFSISRRFIFEITESLFLSDSDHIAETLNSLRSLGIELSIDDFGTGYSSMSRLKHLPVSELKIDQSFIKDMTENYDDQIIVKSIIDLAHNLGLSVVAEGVETRNILDQLIVLGCDIAQGYLISKPLSKDQFEEFLSRYS